MSAGIRRRARWYALQVLYALDMNRDQDMEQALRGYARRFDIDIKEASITFARTLVTAAVERRDDIDSIVQAASRNWRIDRMSRVDRNILRLATCELFYARDAPIKVIINEAVELAKRYGAAESAAFVNGILDRIAQSRGETEIVETVR